MGARSGGARRLGFEGGANPTLARIPKRGFSNANFRTQFQIVNIADLDRFDDGARVDPQGLADAGLIDDPTRPVKILANGELTKKLTVVAWKFSGAATEKITKAGGSIEQIERFESPPADVLNP